MDCPYCKSTNIREQKQKTKLGYKKYECRNCHKRHNERTGTPYNFLELPTDVVFLVIYHYLRFSNSYAEVAEIFWLRDFGFCEETIRLWVKRFGPLMAMELRKNRKEQAGKSWYVDETYILIDGRWCYLYRAKDREGNLIDVYLSPIRDKKAAIKFFKSAIEVTGVTPDRITTDKHPSYPDAIKQTMSDKVKHRASKYLNNYIEQDHRPIKKRYKLMKTFKDSFCALRFCYSFEELLNFMKPPSPKSKTKLNSSEKCRMILPKFQKLQKMMLAI